MDNGFILLSRGILESDVFASQKLLKIWVWCLCKANFKDKSVPLKIGKGETIIKVKRGSFIFGRNKAEEELFIDGSTIYKSIQKLKEFEMIEINSNNQYSIITICNYNAYQDIGRYKVTSKEQPSNNQVTAKEQPSNTTNNANNYNNDNKVKENDFSIFWDKYSKKVDSKKCKEKFLKLSGLEIDKILKVVDSYVISTPDDKYRKNPLTWLNGKCWEDIEINLFLPSEEKPFGKTNQINYGN